MINEPSFFSELMRRKVYRTGAAYVVGSLTLWGGVEIASQAFELSPTVLQFVILGTVIGLPLALVAAWFFEVRREAGAATTAPPTRSSGRLHVVGISAGMASFLALGIWLGLMIGPDDFALTFGTQRQVTFTGQARGPVFSPSGEFIAYLSGPGGFTFGVHVQDLLSDAEAVDMGVEGAVGLTWTPDGTSVIVSQTLLETRPTPQYREQAVTVPRLGGVPQRLTGEGHATAFAPDGGCLYRLDGMGGLITIDEYEGRRVAQEFSPRLTCHPLDEPGGEPSSWLDVRADSGASALRIWDLHPTAPWAIGRFPGRHSFRLDLNTGEWTELPYEGVIFGRWDHAGERAYLYGSFEEEPGLFAVEFDPKDGEWRGEPVLVHSDPSVSSFDVSDAGDRVAYARESTQQQVLLLDETGRLSELTTGTASEGSPHVSANGAWVVLSRDGWLIRRSLEDSTEGRLARLPDTGLPQTARLSPSGSRLAFVTRQAEGIGVVVVEAATSTQTTIGPLLPPDADVAGLGWTSEDGSLIIAHRVPAEPTRGEHFEISLISFDNHSLEFLASVDERPLDALPTARDLVLIGSDPSATDVATVVSLDAGEVLRRPLSAGGAPVGLTADGDGILVLRPGADEQPLELWLESRSLGDSLLYEVPEDFLPPWFIQFGVPSASHTGALVRASLSLGSDIWIADLVAPGT